MLERQSYDNEKKEFAASEEQALPIEAEVQNARTPAITSWVRTTLKYPDSSPVGHGPE